MAASSSELRSSSMGSTIAPSSATRHGNVEQADSPRKASNERQSCKRELKRAWPYSRRARTSARGGTCSAQPSPSRTSSSVKRSCHVAPPSDETNWRFVQPSGARRSDSSRDSRLRPGVTERQVVRAPCS